MQLVGSRERACSGWGAGCAGKEQERCKGLTLRAIRLLRLRVVGSVQSAQPPSMRWRSGTDRPKGLDRAHPCRRPPQRRSSGGRRRSRPPEGPQSSRALSEGLFRVGWHPVAGATLTNRTNPNANEPERLTTAASVLWGGTVAMAATGEASADTLAASAQKCEICITL